MKLFVYESPKIFTNLEDSQVVFAEKLCVGSDDSGHRAEILSRYCHISPQRSEGEIIIISQPAKTTAAAALVAPRQRAV